MPLTQPVESTGVHTDIERSSSIVSCPRLLPQDFPAPVSLSLSMYFGEFSEDVLVSHKHVFSRTLHGNTALGTTANAFGVSWCEASWWPTEKEGEVPPAQATPTTGVPKQRCGLDILGEVLSEIPFLVFTLSSQDPRTLTVVPKDDPYERRTLCSSYPESQFFP